MTVRYVSVYFLFCFFLDVTTMDYNHEVWIGFLCKQLVRQVVQMSILKCPGCEDKLISPLLHLHQQQSLLTKMKCHFEEVRGPMLTSIDSYYEQVSDLLPHSQNLEKDRVIYINTGRMWLLVATTEAVYYGRYVTDMNDTYINRAFKVKKAKKG